MLDLARPIGHPPGLSIVPRDNPAFALHSSRRNRGNHADPGQEFSRDSAFGVEGHAWKPPECHVYGGRRTAVALRDPARADTIPERGPALPGAVSTLLRADAA